MTFSRPRPNDLSTKKIISRLIGNENNNNLQPYIKPSIGKINCCKSVNVSFTFAVQWQWRHKLLQVLHLHLIFLGDSQLLYSKLLPNISDHYPISKRTPRLLMKECKCNRLYLRSYPFLRQVRANPHHAWESLLRSWWCGDSSIILSRKGSQEWIDWLLRWEATQVLYKEYLSHTETTEVLKGNHISGV